MNQPDGSASHLSISPIKCASVLPGPKFVHVSFDLAAVGQLVDGRPAGAKRHHLARQPLLEFGRRRVERKIEHRLLRVEALQLLREIIEAAANEILRLGERQLLLVGVLVAVRHDFVPAALQLVPQPEVAHRPAMVFIRQHEIGQVRGGDDVDAGRELVLFVDLGRAQARLLEAVVEAEREEVRLSSRRRLFGGVANSATAHDNASASCRCPNCRFNAIASRVVTARMDIRLICITSSDRAGPIC